MNRKQRMDAIEQRLAWLESRAMTPGGYLEARGWRRSAEEEGGAICIRWSQEPYGFALLSEEDAWRYQRSLDVQDDPPEFSCQPQYEPDDDAVIRAARERIVVRPPTEQEREIEEALEAHSGVSHTIRLGAPDDVRERVRERSNLADASADDPLRDAVAQAWKDIALRYEQSLRILGQMVMFGPVIEPADLYALIEGCLAGGRITLDGLRSDE